MILKLEWKRLGRNLFRRWLFFSFSEMTLLSSLFIFSNCPQRQTGSEPRIWSKQFDNRSDGLAARAAGRRRNNQHLTGSRVILLPNGLREERQCSRCVTKKKKTTKTQKTWAWWVALCNQLSCVLLFLLVAKMVAKKSVSSPFAGYPNSG